VCRERIEKLNELMFNLHGFEIAVSTKIKDDVNPQFSDIPKKGSY
jgi:hypothetical protein